MKTRYLLVGAMILSLCCFTSCNKDEELFSSDEIEQMLFDMKGNYYGTVQVAYYHGETFADSLESVAFSRDSLTVTLPLAPMAETIADETIAERLREIGEVTVTMGYSFSQTDGSTIHFGLHPADVVIYGGYGAPPTIRIVLAQNFGGDGDSSWIDSNQRSVIFNVSPIELWVNGEEYEDFRQLVYHFRGETK